jgi:putative NADH-flavin reductase
MNLFVLGATGKTGRILVAQGLARGHAITAFGRSALQDGATRTARIVVGDPMDADGLATVISGHDAVLSALGTRGLGATSVLRDSARAISAGMQRAGVRRLIVMSSSLVDTNGGWFSSLLSRTLLRHTAGDQRAMEQLITESPLDWTVLRPARLDGGVSTGRYVASTASNGLPPSGAVLSRGDAAHMMLDTVEREEYIKDIVWVRGARA